MKKNDIYNIQERIDAYRAGTLSDKEIEQLWMELIEYPEQMEYLINSVNLEELAAGIETEQDTVQERATIYQFMSAASRIAAVFLVVIGVLSMVYLFGSEYVFDPKPVSQIELNSFRSSSIPTEVFDYELQRAINLASVEQYNLAIEKLNELEKHELSTNQEILLGLNKGSVLYNNEDFSGAEEIFLSILANHDDMHVLTEEQVHWYLANTYMQMEQEERAQKHFQQTYDLNGAYRRQAARFLN